jgi:flagellar hook-associated protein 3 FlgL
MGAFRVTQRILVDRSLRNIGFQNRAILKLQEQLATGQRVNRPSDDPLDARRAIATRAELNKYTQYLSNISAAGPQLTETETAILTSIDRLQRARELAIQGGSSTQQQPQRDQLAIEVNQLLEGLLVEANHQTNGRYIFAGTRTRSEAFTATRDANGEIVSVAYAGNTTRFDLEIQDGTRVPVNEPGDAVFSGTGPGGVDLFALLVDLRDNLRAGDVGAVGASLADFNPAQDQLGVALARVGSVQNRLQRTDADIQVLINQLEQVFSDSVEADYAEVVLNLNAQSNAFQATLNAAAQVLQPSLLDFIR